MDLHVCGWGTETEAAEIWSTSCPTTLDQDKTGSGIALSNGSLTATRTDPVTGAGHWFRSISTSSRSGKYVYKFLVDNNAPIIPDQNGVGVVDGTQIGDGDQWAGRDAHSCGYYVDDGLVYFNFDGGYPATPIDIIPSGGSGLVAVDYDARKVWFKKLPDGDWNANPLADPAAGTGAIDITGMGDGGVFAAVEMDAPIGVFTFDFEPSEMLPTGFLPWCLGDVWSEQEETAVVASEQSEQSDPWSEQSEHTDEYDEKDECGR
jgi:hypothetical protein